MARRREAAAAAALLHLLLVVFCGLGGGPRAGVAARMPTPSIVGADLLVKVAESCDILAAWRVLGSSSLNAESLVATGSKGETPLMAAARNGCAEMAALLMLHPAFDKKRIKKPKQRRLLKQSVLSIWRWQGATEDNALWALEVVDGILDGMDAKKELEWDPSIAEFEHKWFLPEPDEWFPPTTLDELGIERVKPVWNLSGLVNRVQREYAVAFNELGHMVRLQDFDKLWFLMTSWLQSAEGTEQKSYTHRHIRSIGWSLFFWGGRRGLNTHANLIRDVIRALTPLDRPPDDAEVHKHLVASGVNVTEAYENLPSMLYRLWNRTGDWVTF